MTVTLIILAVTAALFVWGKIRSDIVALLSLIALVLSGVLTTEEALSGFSNNIVIMIAALFIVGGAISQTGLASAISKNLLKFAGQSSLKLFTLIMLVTSLIGSFLSNTGTVALLLPIVVSMASSANIDVRRLLMPMAFASGIGGMMTLIGTPPTLIVHDSLINAGYNGLQFFTTLPVGIILLIVGMLLLWPLTKVLEKKNKKEVSDGKTTVKSPDQLVSEYKLTDNLYRLEIPKASPVIGKKLSELAITQHYEITITEIRRRMITPISKTVSIHLPEADTVLNFNEVLYIVGDYENVEKFAADFHLNFIDGKAEEGLSRPKFAGKLKFDEIGMAEVVLLSNTRLKGKTVRDSGFRNNYNVNIVAIQRQDHYIIKDLKDEKMQPADMLLVQGTWENIDRLNRLETEVVVIGQPENEASKITLDQKAPIAAITLILMVLAMVFNWLTPVMAVLIASVIMILAGCFRTVRDAYRTINWESVILFAAMIPLSTAMEKTGASALISESIVHSLGSYGPYAVLTGILLATSLLTMFISNTATAILFAPIALQAANTLDVNPYPFLIGVAVAASMCLASPFATPPNAMVMSAGKYNFMDYVKVGLPLQIIYILLMIVALPLLFPF